MKIDRKSPELLILLMTIGAAISWAVWLNLLNNFAIEKVDFTGAGIAAASLLLALNMPSKPAAGNEVLLGRFS